MKILKVCNRPLIIVSVLLLPAALAHGQAQNPSEQKTIFPDAVQQVFSSATSLGVPDAIKKHQNAVVPLNDNFCVEAISRGERLMKSGDIDGAVAAFRQAAGYEPQDELALQRLGRGVHSEGATERRHHGLPQIALLWPRTQGLGLQQRDRHVRPSCKASRRRLPTMSPIAGPSLAPPSGAGPAPVAPPRTPPTPAQIQQPNRAGTGPIRATTTTLPRP